MEVRQTMNRLLFAALVAALVMSPVGTACAQMEGEWGDAPEGSVAYPFLIVPVTGQFPTCAGVGPAGIVYHGPLCWAHFPGTPTLFDFEFDGNASNCPNFPPYDADECFVDDAGLMFPDPYTIDATLNVVPCPQATGFPLGNICTVAQWGIDIDIMVTNTMPCVGYVNVLMDWDQSGTWAGSSNCPGIGPAAEHILVDHPVPIGYGGPLSGLPIPPPSFLIGPNDQFVWCRFTISEALVGSGWDGSGSFEDGETEDYLLEIHDPTPTETESWGTLKGLYR